MKVQMLHRPSASNKRALMDLDHQGNHRSYVSLLLTILSKFIILRKWISGQKAALLFLI